MEQGRVRREGIVVGMLGATAVVVWFFIADVIAGHLLFTPYALGSVLQGFFGVETPASIPATILMYTIFHYLSFIAVGLIFSAIFNAAEREPSILAGFAILFVALEIGCLGLTVMVQESSALRQIAWYQIGAANLVASVAMGTYLVRRHRHVISRVALSLSGV
ncbi:MAG TPA: hypothetical protein PLX31_19485 [Gemmatimonadaceae bacterium]|nr:hypothetical protein [Gemmatimonadaceae bacterium]